MLDVLVRWIAAFTFASFVLAPVSVAATSEDPAPLGDLAFLIGEWSAEWKLFPGDQTPPSGHPEGKTTVAWGPQRAWVELRSAAAIPETGPYEVAVLIVPDRTSAGNLQAFVVNTFGFGALYRGEAAEEGKLEFVTDVGERTQRVTYARLPGGRVRFLVEESDDGRRFQPHSEAVWRPAVAVSEAGATLPQARQEPATRLLVRPVTGPYARHPQVLEELLARASTLGLAADRIVAIYLSDPSRTPPEELRWDLGVVLDENFEGAPGEGFELRELPVQEVVAVTTTLPEMGAASLTIDDWMASAGLKQVGPTRVVWLREPGDDAAPGEPGAGSVELVKPAGPGSAKP